METVSDVKKVYAFINSNDLDDSSTGLDYLYGRMNEIIMESATEQDWLWIKDNCFRYNDRLFYSIIDVYKENHRDEIVRILDGINEDDEEDDEDVEDEDDEEDCLLDAPELYWHSAAYYKALCLQGTPEYEDFLDKQLGDDFLSLKADLHIARGEKEAVFALIKDKKRLVLKATGLLDGEEKEQYLLAMIKQYPTSEWWEEQCKCAGDKYVPELIDSPKHSKMVNDQLYASKRYEELIKRINTGWVSDDYFGNLNDNIGAKYSAIKPYKKLEKLYHEWYCRILVDYSVYMIERNGTRKSYHYSAGTMKRANRICAEAGLELMGSKVAKELAEQHPKRVAMIEEFRMAGLMENFAQ